jgi:hypothetical protein
MGPKVPFFNRLRFQASKEKPPEGGFKSRVHYL